MQQITARHSDISDVTTHMSYNDSPWDLSVTLKCLLFNKDSTTMSFSFESRNLSCEFNVDVFFII